MKFWNEMPKRFKRVCVRLPILTLVISAVVYYFLGLGEYQIGNFIKLGTFLVPWPQWVQIIMNPVILFLILLYTYVYNKTLKEKENLAFAFAFAFAGAVALFAFAFAGAVAVALFAFAFAFAGAVAVAVALFAGAGAVAVALFAGAGAVAFMFAGVDPVAGAFIGIILSFILTILFWSVGQLFTKKPWKFLGKKIKSVFIFIWNFFSGNSLMKR